MDKSITDKVVHRLAIAEGHLKKVREMVEDGEYCLNVIHQSQAVQAALKKVDEEVLHGHLHSCVLNDMHDPKGKNEKFIDEIFELFGKKN